MSEDFAEQETVFPDKAATGSVVDGAGTVPSKIDRFTILEVVEVGGMGIVCKATQKEPFERTVAIKFLRRLGDISLLLPRLRKECDLLSRISHRGVVSLLTANFDSQPPYFVMEFLAGAVPLASFCSNTLPLRDRLRLFLQVCEAVDFIHSQGILHLDLSHRNVLACPGTVRQNGGGNTDDSETFPNVTVKVVDFGLSRLAEDTRRPWEKLSAGTPDYVSPERLSNPPGKVGSWSDVYSLGVLLYYLCTGEAPGFKEVGGISRPIAPSKRLSVRIGDACEKDRPALVRLQAALRGDVDKIILRAIQIEPAERYQKVGELAEDIEKHLTGYPLANSGRWSWARWSKFLLRNGTLTAVLGIFVTALAVTSVLAVRGCSSARDEKILLAIEVGKSKSQEEKAKVATGKAYSGNLRSVSELLINHDYTAARRVLREALEMKAPGWEWSHLWRASNSCEMVYGRSTAGFSTVAVIGPHLVAGSRDGSLWVWRDVESKATIHKWNSNPVAALTTCEERGVATVTNVWEDGTFARWRVGSGKRTKEGNLAWPKGQDGSWTNGSYASVCLSESGKCFFVLLRNGTVWRYDLDGEENIGPKLVQGPDGLEWDVVAVTLTDESFGAVVAEIEGDAFFLSLYRVPLKDSPVRSHRVARHHVGRIDSKVTLAELSEEFRIRKQMNISLPAESDVTRALVGLEDRVIVWRWKEKDSEWISVHEHQNHVAAVAMGRSGDRVISGGGLVDGDVMTFKLDSLPDFGENELKWTPRHAVLRGHLQGITSVAIGVSAYYSASEDGTIRKWNWNEVGPKTRLHPQPDPARELAGMWWTGGGENSKPDLQWAEPERPWVREWGVYGGTPVAPSTEQIAQQLAAIGLNPVGDAFLFVAAGNRSGTAVTLSFELRGGLAEERQEYKKFKDASIIVRRVGDVWDSRIAPGLVASIAVSSKGDSALGGRSKLDSAAWTWEAGGLLKPLNGLGRARDTVVSMDFSPQVDSLVACTKLGEVLYWDPATIGLEHRVEIGGPLLSCVEFAPNGKFALVGCEGSGGLWRTSISEVKAERVPESRIYGRTIGSISFNPDPSSGRVAIASDDFQVRIWDASSKFVKDWHPIISWRDYEGYAGYVAWSANAAGEEWIAASGANGGAWLYEGATETAALSRLAGIAVAEDLYSGNVSPGSSDRFLAEPPVPEGVSELGVELDGFNSTARRQLECFTVDPAMKIRWARAILINKLSGFDAQGTRQIGRDPTVSSAKTWAENVYNQWPQDPAAVQTAVMAMLATEDLNVEGSAEYLAVLKDEADWVSKVLVEAVTFRTESNSSIHQASREELSRLLEEYAGESEFRGLREYVSDLLTQE